MRLLLLSVLTGFFLFSPKIIFAGKSALIFNDSQVATIEITIDPQRLDWIFNPDNAYSDSLHPCTVRFKNALIDTVVSAVGFRLRGNTSRTAAKKSFKLSFNTFEPGRKFFGIEKLNLNGEHNDPSIVRSKLCWDFFEKIGLHASASAHVAVYINGAYYGLYVLVEHVDEQFLKTHFKNPSGNLWKCLWPADLTWRGDSPQNYYPYYDEERPYNLKTNVQTYDFKPLARLIRILNKTADDVFIDSLMSVFDVPDLMKYFAANLLLGSWDDYWSLMNNYYLYYDYSEKKFHLIPYDYDNTFGVDFFGIDWANADIYDFPKVTDGARPLAERIMNNPSLRNLYTHYLKFYRDSVFALRLWQNEIDEIKDRIAPFAEADTYRTKDYGFTIEDFYNSYNLAHYENQHVKYGIKEYVSRRYSTAGSQIKFIEAAPVIYALKWSPKIIGENDSVKVEISAFAYPPLKKVTLNFQPGNLTVVQKSDMTRAPVYGAPIVENRDRWIVTLPPLGEYGFGHFQIEAENVSGAKTFYPSRGGIKISSVKDDFSGLVINEFLAKNDMTNADPAGEYDDWVELYNKGTKSVSLAGLYLTDDSEAPDKWQFPDTVRSLAPGEYRLIWCDNDAGQEGLHASFKLAAGGEFIGLVAPDGGTFLDSLSFGEQTADLSFGRFPDGEDNWIIMKPTPGSSNLATSVENKNGSKPKSFQLTVFPNPSNQSVTLRYTLPEAGVPRLTVYSLNGQKVWESDGTKKK
ncbi:MAG: hypothetical protein GXO77_07740 [Calditrichaeota bacterium]|nr:hypothetical protein [Calditrichota bacterium]